MSEQIDRALRWAIGRLQSFSETPRLDAELLLAHCLDKPRSHLYAWPEAMISESCRRRFRELIERRLQPTPVAYLLGRREFYSLEFAATPAALVPRPETELLVDMALQNIPVDRADRVCDLGTGTGIIAIALKKNRPLARVSASDVDSDCLALARNNAKRHTVDIDWLASDWYRDFPPHSVFEMIVSNPPYVAAGHPFLQRGDLPGEPALALTPGESGLEAIEIIIGGAPDHLAPGGLILLEHGYDQQAPVARLLRARGFGEVRCETDLNGLPRASMGRLPG